jgi:tetratricopeptide (TPR) repeat protein
MTRHPRLPALIVLVSAATLGALYLVAWGQIEKHWKNGGNQTLDALKKQVETEGKSPRGVSAETWLAYADALANAKQFAPAADAYKEVIALQPSKRDAKFQCGLALAQADAPNPFYDYLKELVYGDPKVAEDLFNRPETQTYLKEDRFVSLAKEAKNQAMD